MMIGVAVSCFALVLSALPASASSLTHPPVTRVISTHAHATVCGPVYVNGVQAPLQVQKDCGGSITVPASVVAGPCTSFPSIAVCQQQEDFTVGLSVPGQPFCSTAYMTNQVPAKPGVTCMDDPIISLTAYAPGGYGTKGILYGTSFVSGGWCGGKYYFCAEARSQPSLLGLGPNPKSYPPTFTLYIVVTLPGVFFAVEHTTVHNVAYKQKASLDVALSSDASSKGLSVGSASNVTATVTASGGTVNNISLGNGLSSSTSAVTIGTAPSGLSGFTLADGASKTFQFSVTGKNDGKTSLGLDAKGTSSSGSVSSSGSLNLIVGAPSLQVIVSADPAEVRVNDVPATIASPGGAPVTVTVRVKNNGSSAVKHLFVNEKLLVSYNDGDPLVNAVPLRQDGTPSPVGDLGTLAKGATSKPVKFTMLAKGDGGYAVEALASAQPAAGGTIRGVGTTSVKISTPLLAYSTKLGSEVLTGPGNLATAGVPYSVDVTMQDLSYRKDVAISTRFAFDGNAQGGQLIPIDDGTPVQDTADLEQACAPTGLVTLIPREKKEFKLVVYTQSAWVRAEGKTGGGTRSIVTVNPPVAGIPNKAGDDVETFLKPSDIQLTGDTRYEVSLADPGFAIRPPPTAWDDVDGVLYLSRGFLLGVGAFEYGLAHGLLVDLPKLVLQGIQAVPTAVLNMIALESDLYESVKDNPALMTAAVISPVTNLILLQQHNAPAFGATLKKISDQVNSRVYSYLKTLSEDWEAGNWKGAVEEFAASGTELTLNAATMIPSVASCVLVRAKPILAALSEAKAAAFASASEKIGSLSEVVSATSAITKISELVPGMRLGYEQLLKLYGLSREQVDFLRQFAVDNKLLITVRGRASSSVDWLAGKVVNGVKYAGAVLKPEQIKIKTVSWLDTEVLGYRASDLGRVILRKPITGAELQANLRARGITSTVIDAATGQEVANPVWQDAFKLLNQRVNEYTHARGGFVSGSGGYYRDLTDAAAEGKITLRWNLAENAVDPTIAKNGYTTYKFRLFDEGGGNLVPEFFAGGKWRCVTGDVDFLSMARANATPIDASSRVKLYSALAGNNPINMLHPAADTWTSVKSFWFPAKQNEFARAGMVPEFDPDGNVRTVLYDPKLSYWISPEVYRPVFFGSYVPPPTY
jgi:hypothetical protein